MKAPTRTMRAALLWTGILCASVIAPGVSLARGAQIDDGVLFPTYLYVRGETASRQSAQNVNERYEVESASVSGVAETSISQALRDDIEELVGRKYDPEAAEHLAERLREELPGYTVSVKVRRGERAQQVKVVFDARHIRRQLFDVRLSPLLYSNEDGFSLSLVPGFETHHNHFSFGFVTNANNVPKRETGLVLRYEHRKVGTSAVQVGIEYDYFWSTANPPFRPASDGAVIPPPLVYGTYDTRELFSPSISVLPTPDIKVTVGTSFQTLEIREPTPLEQASHAFTLGVQYRKEVRPRRGVRHTISAEYLLRDATSRLASDLVYTRHWIGGDYSLGVGRQEFAFSFLGGHGDGEMPLFERFSIGSATTLRGWDRFDVTPLGGRRLLYGSLAYRYSPFELFYDFGAVWDPALEGGCSPLSCGPASPDWKHSVGIGLSWRNGFFLSVGVPARARGVRPAVMFGFRR